MKLKHLSLQAHRKHRHQLLLVLLIDSNWIAALSETGIRIKALSCQNRILRKNDWLFQLPASTPFFVIVGVVVVVAAVVVSVLLLW